MNFLTDHTGTLYRKFLAASMGSALVMSIYSFVDTIAVGQSEGPVGAAAMAIITPLYGIIVFLAILCGIGGSVLMGNARGEGKEEKGNACFTISVLVMAVLTALFWVVFFLFHDAIFTFFGADPQILQKVMEYSRWIILFFPVFIAPTFLGAFIRNDGAPALAMGAVIAGGCVNILGDWFFVFPLGMGMEGAAVATVIGTTLQVVIMGSHFFRKKCRLKLVKPRHISSGVKKIFIIGFGASILDLGTVIITVMMNNQVMRYGNATQLAIYGVVTSVSALFQALFSGVGQAIQPLVSANCGAGNTRRMKSFWRMSFVTTLILGLLFTGIGEFFPIWLVKLFVNATPEVIAAAPPVVRLYFLIFPFLGITVLAVYYLQSALRDKMSLLVSLLHSAAVSGLLIYLLPAFLGISGVWLALPLSDFAAAIVALLFVRRSLADARPQ